MNLKNCLKSRIEAWLEGPFEISLVVVTELVDVVKMVFAPLLGMGGFPHVVLGGRRTLASLCPFGFVVIINYANPITIQTCYKR